MSTFSRARITVAVLGIALAAGTVTLATASTVRGPHAVRAGAPVAARSSKTFVYGCAPVQNACYVYNSAGTLVKTISSSQGVSEPAGTMANAKGVWYVANAGSASISIFSVAGGSLIGTLSDPNEEPGDVAVTKKLTVVSNVTSLSSAPGSVSVYKKTATSPSYMLMAPGALAGSGVAIDAKGNCYWSYNTGASSGGHIVEFAGCKPKSKAVDLGLTLGNAGGLAFDGGNNLWFTDQSSGLYQCVGVSSCTLVASGFGDPLGINFNKGATTLYLADPTTGIYAITGFASNARLKAHPSYIVTPFASAIGVYGVTPGPT